MNCKSIGETQTISAQTKNEDEKEMLVQGGNTRK